MCKICPKCGSIAEFDAYYNRIICTRCEWESEKVKQIKFTKKINQVNISQSNKKITSKLVKV